MHHTMPRHEDRLLHDGLDFHRAYPDSHNIHAHAIMIGEDLTARYRLVVMPLDRWQSGQKCSDWEN
jgi:hypothetical protein